MSSRICSVPENLAWKKAYMAAVLEKDRGRLPGLIQEATRTLSERLRELWATGAVPSDELESIDDALYLLHALRSSLAYRDDGGEWNRSVLDS
jgi:hypothetical protein